MALVVGKDSHQGQKRNNEKKYTTELDMAFSKFSRIFIYYFGTSKYEN